MHVAEAYMNTAASPTPPTMHVQCAFRNSVILPVHTIEAYASHQCAELRPVQRLWKLHGTHIEGGVPMCPGYVCLNVL